jgi:hypothetical protein
VLLFNSDIYYAGIGTANLQYRHRTSTMLVLQISRANTSIVDVTIKKQEVLNRSNDDLLKQRCVKVIRMRCLKNKSIMKINNSLDTIEK